MSYKIVFFALISARGGQATRIDADLHLCNSMSYRMLPRYFRLTKTKDFEQIFKFGRFFDSQILAMKVYSTKTNISRFGFVVSNKISKSAVVRNKIKRRLREIISLKLKSNSIKKSYDIVVIAKPPIIGKTYQEIEKSLIELLDKAKLLTS